MLKLGHRTYFTSRRALGGGGYTLDLIESQFRHRLAQRPVESANFPMSSRRRTLGFLAATGIASSWVFAQNATFRVDIGTKLARRFGDDDTVGVFAAYAARVIPSWPAMVPNASDSSRINVQNPQFDLRFGDPGRNDLDRDVF
jgi:hypothetical protein